MNDEIDVWLTHELKDELGRHGDLVSGVTKPDGDGGRAVFYRDALAAVIDDLGETETLADVETLGTLSPGEAREALDAPRGHVATIVRGQGRPTTRP